MLELDAVIDSANTWIGTPEQPSGSDTVLGITNWLDTGGALGSGYEWCAAAVSRWLSDGGVNDLYGDIQFSNGVAKTDLIADHFQGLGRYDMNAQKGDLVLFDGSTGDEGVDHIGLVTGVNLENGTFSTIEGNASDMVEANEYSLTDSIIDGFAHPNYEPLEAGPLGYPGYSLEYVEGSPILHNGDTKHWQEKMQELGYDIEADGEYGPLSADVTRQFQQDRGLVASGIVDQETWDKAFFG